MLIQLLAIASVVVLTFLFLAILGPRPSGIFLSLQERSRWNTLIGSRLGGLMFVANVSATLTSLATVYLFFIGTSSLFGFVTYLSVVTIIFGAFFTALISKRFLSIPSVRIRLNDISLSSVAIASLFWGPTPNAQRVSQIVKIITLVSIFSILWLEFASLARLAGAVFGIDYLFFRCLFMFLSVLFVVDFTIRNGLRGFIFADLLLAPLILLGASGLLTGVYIHGTPDVSRLVALPQLPVIDVIVFCVATIFLNLFIVICSEGHWLRTWSMPGYVFQRTAGSGLLTGAIWLLLILAGLFAAGSLSHSAGVSGVIEILGNLARYSNWYGVFFWVGATSAILSTADGQLYAGLVLASFDTRSGLVEPRTALISRSVLMAFTTAALFTIIFIAVDVTSFPFDQILFFSLPFFLCLAPAFIQCIVHGQAQSFPLILSSLLYIACGLMMLILPPQFSLLSSLAAPLMPLLVCFALMLGAFQ